MPKLKSEFKPEEHIWDPDKFSRPMKFIVVLTEPQPYGTCHYGPFDTSDEAYEWVKNNDPTIKKNMSVRLLFNRDIAAVTKSDQGGTVSHDQPCREASGHILLV